VVRAADDPAQPNLRVQFLDSIAHTRDNDKRGGLESIPEDLAEANKAEPRGPVPLRVSKPIDKLRPTIAGRQKQRHNAVRSPHRCQPAAYCPPLQDQYAHKDVDLAPHGTTDPLEPGEFEVEQIVGVVAGLVKVANGQTDRLARIFVAQRPLRAHWGSSESLRAQRPLRGLSCDEDHCFSFAGTTTGNKEVETLLPQGLLETAIDSNSK